MTYNELMKATKNHIKTYKKYACYENELFEHEYVLSHDLPINVNVKLKKEVANSCRKYAKDIKFFEKNFCNQDNVCMKIEIYDENDITFFDLNGKQLSHKDSYISFNCLCDNNVVTSFYDDLIDQVKEYNPIDFFLNELEKHKTILKSKKINYSFCGTDQNDEIIEKETKSFNVVKKALYNNIEFKNSFEKELEISDGINEMSISTEINPFYLLKNSSFSIKRDCICYLPCLNRDNFEKETIELINKFLNNRI